MSLNQPSRLFVSTSDLEYSFNDDYPAQNSSYTLPEQLIGVEGIDLARAVIPTTQYNVPDYQSKFWYGFDNAVDSLTLTNNRFFDEIADLITQLNTDAVAQGKPLTFAYDTTKRRIQITTSNITQVVITTNNQKIPFNYTVNAPDPLNPQPTQSALAIIPLGTYTKATFLTALGTAITNQVFATLPASSVAVSATADVNNVITLTAAGAYTGYWFVANMAENPYGLTQQQILGFRALLGIYPADTNIFQIKNSITFALPSAVIVVPVFKAVSSDKWGSQFALNTRLGFGVKGVLSVGNTITGSYLPNILRTRVIYVCTNITTNGTLAFNNNGGSLRAVLAKVPVNSTYGGMTVYENNDYNFCKTLASQIQTVEIYLLDEELQPYLLRYEEPAEFEFVCTYKEVDNA